MEFKNVVFIFLVTYWVHTVNSKPGYRIIGGQDAPVGWYPFSAAIYKHTNTSRSFCGGALLNNEWIITSGHCAYGGEQFTILLGSNYLTSEDPDRVTVVSSEYVVHPDFDPNNIKNDIALIKLRMPISYTNYIQPINLPVVSLLNYTAATVVGWGETNDYDGALSDHLQYVNVKILSNVECRQIYGNQITDEMACAEGNYNEGTCTGDTGGPLIEYLSRLYWIVGVASFISGNGCESTDPSGFTRVYPYYDWIKGVMNL